MKDIRMPTPFTTSNAEETGMGTKSIVRWPKKEKEREEDKERRRRAESLK